MKKYTKQEFYQMALVIAKDPDIYFIDDVVALMPLGKSKFYEMFPATSEEMEALREILDKNCIEKKKKMRKNWAKEEASPTLQMALMKIISTSEERRRLMTNYNENNDNITIQKPLTKEEIEQAKKDFNDLL